MFTATKYQTATYLLGICLSSISILVFVNATVSFVITTIIHKKHRVGDAVGTLGFADELLALVACPLWGLLSDYAGARTVCVVSYAIIGVSLFLFVQARNVYPQLLLVRLLFSLGAAGNSTMITALLPSMTAVRQSNTHSDSEDDSDEPQVSGTSSSAVADRPAPRSAASDSSRQHLTTRSAGIVGLSTGCGALLALIVYLRLPNFFETSGIEPESALADSYYVVGSVALALSIACVFGLRRLQDEAPQDPHSSSSGHASVGARVVRHIRNLFDAVALAFRHGPIGLAYAGGLVARASSIGITLFVPLFVNVYFVTSGKCDRLGKNPSDVKDKCKEAYILASELTGFTQVFALIFAPLFGFLAERYRRFNICLLLAAFAGVVGYGCLGALQSPKPSGHDGSPWIFPIMALLGISQIGAIVCSLGLLARVILEYESGQASSIKVSRDNWLPPTSLDDDEADHAVERGALTGEQTTLLRKSARTQNLEHVKGAIAGVYSFGGGVGILVLTKVGGYLFDSHPAAPFHILASFNGILLAIGLVCALREKRNSH